MSGPRSRFGEYMSNLSYDLWYRFTLPSVEPSARHDRVTVLERRSFCTIRRSTISPLGSVSRNNPVFISRLAVSFSCLQKFAQGPLVLLSVVPARGRWSTM